jgi:hypothetical protein
VPSQPAQAWIRVERIYTHTSILRMPGEVSVQQMTSHFLSLPSGVLCWVRQKGDQR